MGRYRKNVWEGTSASFGLSILYGVICGFMSCIILSGVSFLVFRGMMFGKLFTLITLFVSGYSSGYICGKYRRRRGLIDGAICGGAIYLLLLIISMYIGEFTDIRKFFLLMAAGAIGGVGGVNTPRPKNLM